MSTETTSIMAGTCTQCVSPLKVGDCFVICELGCGALLHSACVNLSLPLGTQTVVCGLCEPAGDSVETLRARLVELQRDFTNLKLTLSALQETDAQECRANSGVVFTVTGKTASVNQSTPVPPAAAAGREKRRAKRARRAAAAAAVAPVNTDDAAAALESIHHASRERKLARHLLSGDVTATASNVGSDGTGIEATGKEMGACQFATESSKNPIEVGAKLRGTAKRDRAMAEITDSFGSAMDASIVHEDEVASPDLTAAMGADACSGNNIMTAPQGNPAGKRIDHDGSAVATRKSRRRAEMSNARKHRGDDATAAAANHDGRLPNGGAPGNKGYKRRANLKRGASEGNDGGLEFAMLRRTSRPRFYGVFLDGLSKTTTAQRILDWYISRGISPKAVWKLRRQGTVSAFCISLRKEDIKSCVAREFYPKEISFRRWGGAPPVSDNLETAQGPLIDRRQ